MFDNRHCVETDYVLLDKETNKIINSILNNSTSLKDELNAYLKLISRFDLDIVEKLTYCLSRDNLSPNEMVNIINQYINTLKQQVLVDIREHN